MNRMTKAAIAAAFIAGTVFAVAVAQDQGAQQRFGDDMFASGTSVRVLGTGLEDAFAAGQTVVLAAPLTESAHMAGRTVRIEQAVGRDVYGAGNTVSVNAPVTGDVTAFGEEVEVAAPVGDDVLAFGRSVVVSGPVTGNAMLFGETVEIAGVITGSVQIRAGNIKFGPAARIDGTLTYWNDKKIEIPASVISPDRVTAKITARKESGPSPSPVSKIAGKVTGLVVMLVLGAILAALIPNTLARAKEGVAARPWSHLLFGVVAMSALFGSILVFAVSVIGIPLALVMLIVIPLGLLLGYLTAGHVLGSLALGLARVRLGDGRLAAIAAMSAGLILLFLIKLIPILGWILAVLAVIFGLGAWFVLWVKPAARGRAAAET